MTSQHSPTQRTQNDSYSNLDKRPDKKPSTSTDNTPQSEKRPGSSAVENPQPELIPGGNPSQNPSQAAEIKPGNPQEVPQPEKTL